MKTIFTYGTILYSAFFYSCIETSQANNNQTSSIPKTGFNSETNPNSIDLLKNINTSVKKWTGTIYSQEKGTDCSGIFHKVINDLRKHYPNEKFPKFKIDRSSRDLAAWYHTNSNFSFIRNPEDNGKLIKPGMIMFYGKGGMSYDLQSMTIKTLTDPNGVNHVGIVTAVNKDHEGNVISYDIFHGLNERKPAQTTTEVYKNPRRPTHPAYAHWNQPWLGIATFF